MTSQAMKRARRRAAAHIRREMGEAVRGRPPLPGTGEPGSRRVIDMHAREFESEKKVKSVAVEARSRHHDIPKNVADSELGGSVLGLMRHRGQITESQYMAGKRYGLDMQRYYSLSGHPHPSPKAQNIMRVRGKGGDAPAEEIQSAANKMMKLDTVLGKADTSGRPVTTVVKRVCILDNEDGVWQPHMIKHLKKGLHALAVEYGIEKATNHPFGLVGA